MSHLNIQLTPSFKRDVKLLDKKHIDDKPLEGVIDLIAQNSPESQDILKRRHNMHTLGGKWKGSNECHVCNIGDWLLVWRVTNDAAILQRTGTHDSIFR